MASGAFVDPVTLLRLIPLLTSTATLTFAGNQHWIFRLFTHPDLTPQNHTFLPKWFNLAFHIGLPKVVGLLAASAIGALVNLRSAGDVLRAKGAYTWYMSGAVLAGAHLLFVPAVAPRVKGIVDDGEGKGRCLEEMRGWLRVNAWRSLTVDFGAWACFVVAATKALGP